MLQGGATEDENRHTVFARSGRGGGTRGGRRGNPGVG